MERVELIILRNLIYNEEYCKKILPYLKEDYFTERTDIEIFKTSFEFIDKYANQPSIEAIKIILIQKIHDPSIFNEIKTILTDFENNKLVHNDEQWLLDETEKFCQERAIKQAIIESLEILDNRKKDKHKGIIPELLTNALGISFNRSTGHDYFEDSNLRYEYYHKKENKIPFDIDWLNTITNGGTSRKTLNMVLAGVNVGKSLTLCHFASWYLSQGLNVYYGSGEISEEEIGKRIDANLFDLNLEDIVSIPKNLYDNNINRIHSKTHGKLIIEEYPTGTSSIIDIRANLHELLLKKDFRPDVILLDYIGVFASSRVTAMGGLYALGKSIAEEFRGLAQTSNSVLWTAVQFNREGYKSSSPGMGDIGESFGIAMTADFAYAEVTNDEMEESNQYLVSQIKNRYGNVTKYKKHVIGVSREKQRLYNVDASESENIIDSNPLPEINNDRHSKFGKFKF